MALSNVLSNAPSWYNTKSSKKANSPLGLDTASSNGKNASSKPGISIDMNYERSATTLLTKRKRPNEESSEEYDAESELEEDYAQKYFS